MYVYVLCVQDCFCHSRVARLLCLMLTVLKLAGASRTVEIKNMRSIYLVQPSLLRLLPLLHTVLPMLCAFAIQVLFAAFHRQASCLRTTKHLMCQCVCACCACNLHLQGSWLPSSNVPCQQSRVCLSQGEVRKGLSRKRAGKVPVSAP